MKNKALWIGAGVGVCIILGVLFLVTRKEPEPNDSNAKFLHCPKCLTEYPFTANMKGKPCFQCAEPGVNLMPTVRSITAPSRGGTIFAIAVIFTVLGEAALYFFLVRLKAMQEKTPKIIRLKCRCGKCKRKIAYPSTKVGHESLCPACKNVFILPEAALEEVEE
jgi:hypothetical protein